MKDMKAGDIFKEDNIRSIRPGYGLLPKFLKDILGRRAGHDIKRVAPLNWRMVS